VNGGDPSFTLRAFAVQIVRDRGVVEDRLLSRMDGQTTLAETARSVAGEFPKIW